MKLPRRKFLHLAAGLPRFQLCRVLRERNADGAQMVCFRYFRQRGQQ